MENTESAKELAIAFIIKYGLLVAFVTFGGVAQVLLSNQKEKLNFIQNLAIFFTCCLIGGSWGYYFVDNRTMLTMSGIVSLLGYHKSFFAWCDDGCCMILSRQLKG